MTPAGTVQVRLPAVVNVTVTGAAAAGGARPPPPRGPGAAAPRAPPPAAARPRRPCPPAARRALCVSTCMEEPPLRCTAGEPRRVAADDGRSRGRLPTATRLSAIVGAARTRRCRGTTHLCRRRSRGRPLRRWRYPTTQTVQPPYVESDLGYAVPGDDADGSR